MATSSYFQPLTTGDLNPDPDRDPIRATIAYSAFPIAESVVRARYEDPEHRLIVRTNRTMVDLCAVLEDLHFLACNGLLSTHHHFLVPYIDQELTPDFAGALSRAVANNIPEDGSYPDSIFESLK